MRKKKAQNTYIDVNLIPFSGLHEYVAHFHLFLFLRSRFQKSTEFQRAARGEKERGGERERQSATRNTKQNYRLRAQHHHKSQVYGYVGRIRA